MPTLDATSSGTGTGTSLTVAHTCSGVDRVLLVAVGTGVAGVTVSGVTYNGVAMTLVGSADTSPSSGTGRRIEFWRLVASATGTHNIVVTPSASTSMTVDAASYTDVDQTTPIRTSPSTDGTFDATGSASSSLTVTGGSASDVVVSGIFFRVADDPTFGGSQTSLVNALNGTNNGRLKLTSQAGGASVTSTFSWTSSTRWAQFSVSLKAAPPSPQTVTIGQAVETDTAQPITGPAVTGTLSQPAETDTAQPLTPALSVTIGQAVETDTAGTLTPEGVVPIGQASETDTALPISAVFQSSLVASPARRSRTADLVVTMLPPVEPVPADYPPDVYWRDSWHYAAPTFDEDDGWSHPKQEKSRPDGITGRIKWGRYQVHIGDVDRTFFRGVQVQVLNWSHETPFGPRLCTLRFNQITPFEELGVDIPWLHDQVKLGLHRIKGDGTVDRDWNWNGIKNSARLSWTPDGWAVDVEFKGFLHQGNDANNRPTSPAGAMHAADIGYRIPHRLNQVIGRKFKRIAQVITGIEQWKKGPLTDTVTAFVLELLALGWTGDGIAWTLLDRPARRWQAHLVLPDPDTVDYTLALGTEGMTLELDEYPDELPNVIYGEWVTPDGARTQNLKYPHLLVATPDFPLGFGAFAPGDDQAGFGPFARWLTRNGYKIYSDDTYDPRDEDEVIDAQDRMGVTADGIVNVTTWGTAFDVGAGDFSDAVYLPIAWDKRVEPYLYTPDGILLGPNPDYDRSIPRRETYINFGENIERADVKQAARQMVARSKRRSLVGTITTPSDPEECSFRDMRASKTLAVPYLDGTGAGGVKFQLSRVEIVEDEQGGYAELQVDTLWRDAYTVAQIIERNREARHNPARLRRQNASALTQDTQPVFDRDNGAGQLGTFPVDGQVWRIVPFPAAAWGTFVRVVAETSPNVEFALMLFAGKVTSNFCARNVGDPLDSKHPYKEHAAELKDAGLIMPWGSKDQPCGYSKVNAADGYKSDDDPPTGRFEWDSSLEWWSERPPLLFLAIWPAADTEITVRFYNQPVDF